MRQWWAGLVVGAVVGGLTASLVVLALAPQVSRAEPQEQTSQVVRARAFELVDEQSRVRARLGIADGVATLLLADQDGSIRMELAVRRDLVHIGLTEPSKERLVQLTLAEESDQPLPSLTLRDKDAFAALSVGRSDTPYNDPAPALALRGTAQGQAPPPRLFLFDGGGQSLWYAP
jgi:hypothetical protein